MRLSAGAAVLALLAQPLSAPPAGDGCVDRYGQIECRITSLESVPGSSQTSGSSGRVAPVPAPGDILHIPTLSLDAGGGLCITFFREVFPGGRSSPRAEQADHLFIRYLDDGFDVCDGTPVPAGLRSPEVVAREYVRTIALPEPRPRIAPGWGIAGKTLFLETQSTLTPPPYSSSTPLGPISVTVTGTYLVDWGDRTQPEPYAVEGGPWPRGKITHVYDRTGHYTVRVTARWTARWQVGGTSGILGSLTTSGVLPAFAVRQVQAVVTG